MLCVRRLAVIALATGFILGSCGSTPPSTSTALQSSGTVAPVATISAFRPRFDATPCPDDVTSDVVSELSCGYLTVLEDRAKPDGRTIQIFVIRLEPPGGTTTPDPVISLGALATQDGYGSMASAGQRTHRVSYLIDPRGVGHSRPSLDCPEVVAAGPALAGLRLRDPARRAMLLDAVRACRDRLVGQGIDPAAYDLAANAGDIEDLRLALGFASWNVNTPGSGSRIAFEVAREFPGGVRSLVIDSPSLPTPDFLTIGPTALDLSISRVVAKCANQPACGREFPDLDTMIRDAVTQLDAKPLTFDVTGTVAAIQLSHPIRVVVDGAALLRWIRADVGSAGGARAAEVPTTVRNVLDGKVVATDGLVNSLALDVGDCLGMFTSCERPNFGAMYSIVCGDLAGQIDQPRLEASIGGRPAYVDVFAPSPLLAACDAWSEPTAGQSPGGPITGGVPTLVMRGALDPYSAPLTDVTAAVGGSTNVFSLEIPNQSYNVLGFTECPRVIRNAWVDAPTAPPADTSCLGQIPPVQLVP